MRVSVFDYGAGNLHSLCKALEAPGISVGIETDPMQALAADALVLPGVGAFPTAAERLAPGRLAVADALASGMPCLAICLGMQLLFDDSEEGEGEGLSVIAGQVTRLVSRRVPHIGWSALELAEREDPGSAGISPTDPGSRDAARRRDPGAAGISPTDPGSRDAERRRDPLFVASGLDVAYFAHSYACRPSDAKLVTAWTTEGDDRFAAAIRWRNVLGVQFHPEKSSAAGVRFVRGFLARAAA